MKKGVWITLALLILAPIIPGSAAPQTASPPNLTPEAAYIDSRVCAECHAKISETYARTGMARSFSRVRPESIVADFRKNNQYYHRASETYFTMSERGGRFYQRRHQAGFQGRDSNIDEKAIDYVIGSGNHVRTYLHRAPSGALLELPVAWYSEKGGYWAMNPGYDKPDQPNSRRKIDYECMFCHNSYPNIPAGHDSWGADPLYSGALPEGIDCQRCHGPGRRHVEQARSMKPDLAALRDSILNPARLPPARAIEICMQCHLETTSFPFPHSILRYERAPFSYQPREPLSNVLLFFDHAPRDPADDRFQIVNSVYRLEKSACFRASQGMMQCTTCHDPHDIPHGDAAKDHYNQACLRCHARALDRSVATRKHTPARDCVDCHMAKRRTADVVHAVMTDHYIQRRPPGNLLVDIPEPHGAEIVYRGPALPYYPRPFDPTPEGDLYLAVAQVRNDNNVARGIPQLAAALAKVPAARPEFLVELAGAWLRDGKPAEAARFYSQAVQRQPDFYAGLLGLGRALDASGQNAQAAEIFQRATRAAPDDARPWLELGQAYVKLGNAEGGRSALARSLQLDDEVPETHYALGLLLARLAKDPRGAESSFREAIRLQPEYAEAHLNLAILLVQQHHAEEAAYHFERALWARPQYTLGHFNYGLLLANQNRPGDAARHFDAALRADPSFAPAHEELGKLAEAAGRNADALREFTEALRLRPQLARSQLGLGAALLKNGDRAGAEKYLRQAASAPDPAIRDAAVRLLASLP